MSHEAPRLPAANEFTPGQLGGPQVIYTLLELIASKGENRDKVIEEIRKRWFDSSANSREDPNERIEQQRKRAANVVTGMRQYGLISAGNSPLNLTDLGQEILASTDNPKHGYDLLAQYLLREKHGLDLINAARNVLARDNKVQKKTIDQELTKMGFVVPTNSSYSGKMRQWLQAADVIDEDWIINQSHLEKLIGVSDQHIDSWEELDSSQQAVLEILIERHVGDKTSIQSHDLMQLLRTRRVSFDPGQIKKKIYDPLQDYGWITITNVSSGRGGKGGLIALTEQAEGLELDLLKSLQSDRIPADLRTKLKTPTSEIIQDLNSDDKRVKGLALELLALRMSTDLGLIPVDMRLRSSQTGGAEVDLVAEGADMHFSRWIFQCKNQKSKVGLSVLAKEIGIAALLRAQVVVIVTTGLFAKTVTDYASIAAESTGIQIVLIDKSAITKYRKSGAGAIRSVFHDQAINTRTLKMGQRNSLPLPTHD